MAQAAVREQISADSDTPGLANADEMLAQLAGSEIDRLLAEADANVSDPSAAESSSASATAPAAQPEESPVELHSAAMPSESAEDQAALSGELDQLFNELQKEVAEKPAPAAKSPAKSAAKSTANSAPAPSAASAAVADPVPAPVSAPVIEAEKPAESALPDNSEKSDAAPQGEERAALLEAAGFENAPAPAAPAAAPAPVAAAAPAAAVTAAPPPSPAAAVDAPAVTNASEKNAVLSAAGFETDKAGAKSSLAEKSVTILIKPLEWMNAPIEFAPVAVRAAIGRAGIVTLINAILVLGYVLIFRKH
jgi:hypothetical protein